MAGAQEMRAIDESLLREERQRRRLDRGDLAAVEARLADMIGGELAIGRLVLAEREQLVEGEIAHFLRKESRATTSPVLPAGFSAFFFSSCFGGATGVGSGARLSPGWNCRPNFTEGSVKEVIASNGTLSRSGRPWKLKVTAKWSSSTSRSQN